MANSSTQKARRTTEQALPENLDNLLHLEEKEGRRNPNELNTKISNIDSSLDQLKNEINHINLGVKSSLEKLSDEGSDLTSKVSETYKQLGTLEKSYVSLSSKSSQIKEEINSVSGALEQLSDKSNSDIGKLNEGYDDLVSKTQQLVNKSRQTARTLNKSIKDNEIAMIELEKRLSSEIESLANMTQDRDDRLEKDIKNQQARLIQLQDVDKALDKRAVTLEHATQDLRAKSKELAKSHNLLNRRTNDLATELDELKQTSVEHRGMIDSIQHRVATLSESLFDLATLQKKRFIGFGSVLALVILLLGAFYVTQRNNWFEEGQINTSVQTELQTIKTKISSIDDHVQGVDQQVQQVAKRVQNMDDSAKTLDGRMNTLLPNQQFGINNTIHGPEWIATQNPNLYVIQLAVVAQKQDIYQIANRYSNFLKGELSFTPVSENRFMLLYGGFNNQYEAQVTLQNLPYYINSERPVIYKVGDIQAQYLSMK